MAPTNPLKTLKALNTTVAISAPVACLPATSPVLIVLATWYAANDIHIAKYVDRYHQIFPESRVLLLRSKISHISLPWTVASALAPAVEILRDTQPQILLHVFSNGGCNTMHHLLRGLRRSSDSPLDLPAYTIILDSCPGYFELNSTYRAIAQPLPKWSRPVLYLLLSILRVVYYALRITPNPNRNASSLLMPELQSRENRRVYLYSTADAFVKWGDVEDHATRASVAGFDVLREVFRGASHVALARSEPDRYWQIVHQAWQSAFERSVNPS